MSVEETPRAISTATRLSSSTVVVRRILSTPRRVSSVKIQRKILSEFEKDDDDNDPEEENNMTTEQLMLSLKSHTSPLPHAKHSEIPLHKFLKKHEIVSEADFCLYVELPPGDSKLQQQQQSTQSNKQEHDREQDEPVKSVSKEDFHELISITAMLLREAGCHVAVYALQHADCELLAPSKEVTSAYALVIGSGLLPPSSSAKPTRSLPLWVQHHPAYASQVLPLAGCAQAQQLTKLILREYKVSRYMYLENGALAFRAETKLLRALADREDLLVQLYPLHRDNLREEMIAKWRQDPSFVPPLREIYTYFGPKIAMYFAWLDFYTKMLLVPGICGVCLYVLGIFGNAQSYFLFSFVVAIGTSVFVDLWKRKQREIEFTWQYSQEEERRSTIEGINTTHANVVDYIDTRPQFRGEWMKDPVTRELIYDFPHHKRFFRQLLAIPLLLSMCCVVGGYVIALNMLSDHLRSQYHTCYMNPQDLHHSSYHHLAQQRNHTSHGSSNSENISHEYIFPPNPALCGLITHGPGMLNALIIYIMDLLYQLLAKKLNEFENYRTAQEFDEHLVMKRMPFHFVNSNASIWFLAFYIQSLDRVRDRLWILMVATQLLDNFKEVGLPFMISLTGQFLTADGRRRRSNSTSRSSTYNTPFYLFQEEEEGIQMQSATSNRRNTFIQERLARVLMQRRQAQYADTFADYKEMMIQYGYVTLYSPVFPLAPLFAWLNNILETRSDFLKLVNKHGYQRPLVQHTQGIGVWEVVLVSFSVIAVIVNCALVWTYELESLLPTWSDLHRFMFVIFCEHLIFLIKVFLKWAAPDLPAWIHNEKRVAALQHATSSSNTVSPSLNPPPSAFLLRRRNRATTDEEEYLRDFDLESDMSEPPVSLHANGPKKSSASSSGDNTTNTDTSNSRSDQIAKPPLPSTTSASRGSGSSSGGSSARKSNAPSSFSPPSTSGSRTAMWSHVGYHRTTIPPEATFDQDNEQIKKDMLGMIVQYLQQEGFPMASATIQDEANVKLLEKLHDKDALRRMAKSILEGDWDLVAKLIHKHLKKFHSQQGFLYAVCKQEYLELIDRQEYQKAFTFLTTHLKPLEKISTMTNRNEFKELCYLLTCKSVGEVDLFRDWEGVVRSREKLVEQLRATFELDELTTSEEKRGSGHVVDIPDNRLVNLLHQAVAYQMEFSRYHPKTVPKVTTLLQDFECEVLPNAVKSTFVGHKQNVKYVTFVGQEGEFLASGSSDTTIKLWPVEFPSTSGDAGVDVSMGEICETWSRNLCGHSSRIWYLTSNTPGDMLYSGSGDGTVNIWDIRNALTDLTSSLAENEDEDADNAQRTAVVRATAVSGEATTKAIANGASLTSEDCVATLHSTGGGDIYSVNLHPLEKHLVTGGYDQTVRLFDIETGVISKTFRGHMASVCDAQFNRHANLIVSGSKDGTIRLWDILSGLCVHTLRQTLGEVTSVSVASNGYTLLSGSRNNSNRLWDLRMLNAPRNHLTTHHHSGSSSNLNGASAVVIGGGGSIHRSGSLHEQRPMQRFKGHQNTAKNIVRASFGPREAFVLGGSEDGAVYVWDVATGKLLEKLVGHQGVTYNAKWHEKQALMASSSHDGTVKTWWWQSKKR